MFQSHIRYLKDNPKGYWFKAKLYGWGWAPATREGWLVIFVYLALILGLASQLDSNATDQEAFVYLLLPVFILTAILIIICYKKGEKPRWLWGPPAKYRT